MPEADAAMQEFGSVPHFVLGGYLVLLLVFGIVGYLRSTASEEDYYLAGRGQGWFVSSLTIMATFFSSFALLGAPGMVYREGVVFALFSLNVPLSGATVYVLGSKIARLGRAKGYVTPADMISDYYGSHVALRLLVALVGFLYAVPYVVMQIQAGGILSEQIFPGEHSFEIGATVLSVITMVYIMIGGMRSVAWTDVVQGILLMGGMLLGGFATVAALGGLSQFGEALAALPAKSLSVPGTTGSWGAEKLLTVCLFASVGSLIQPAQWMRYYAARSTNTLRRSALIFAVALTTCYLFGTMLVGLGGQALYPIIDAPGNLAPNPAVGDDFNQILIVVLKNHLPALLGPVGVFAVSLILVAIMAAAMSTADSNLHAMSGVLTRDVYDRFIRPGAGQKERTWVGRIVIALATSLALALLIFGRDNVHFKPVKMIADMGFLAIAFSVQLLPLTLDMLFVRRGTRAGAVAGLIAGLAIVFLFTPVFSILVDKTQHEHVLGDVQWLRDRADVGFWGLIGNVVVLALVSLITKRPDPQRVAELSRLMDARRQ